MKEFELIARLSKSLPGNETVVHGVGDDCAVLDAGIPGRWLLFKTDAVVEGVHFTQSAAPQKVGRKALARCLSDIAAMGGIPTSAVVTLGLPEQFEPAFLDALYTGMSELARQYDVAIVGGETTSNPERLFVSVALLGHVERERLVTRSGAKPGDAIFVTGTLGGSIEGRHLDFEPRLREARWLTEHFEIHSMIDLSDGLAGDLRHVIHSSGVGAELLKTSIPISRDAKLAARSGASSKPALVAALTDGEDFELLFTVASKAAVSLLDAWKAAFPDLTLTCIGKVIEGNGIVLRDKDSVRPLSVHGYEHFA